MFVKVCGLRCDRDVDACVDAGADAVGFVLTPSPRRVDAAVARALVAGLPPAIMSVAVFQGEPMEVVARDARAAGVDAVQLHGAYGADAVAALSALSLRVIRAVSATSLRDDAGLGEDLLVVDAPAPGSGQTWDWTAMPCRPPGRWLLAGGLRPENVARAIACVEPWGVDVSSGVERSRAVKDPRLIAEFVAAARDAAARSPHAA